MKKIDFIDIDDEGHLDTLSENVDLHITSYPELRIEKQKLIKAYRDYVSSNGNAWSIQQPNLSDKLKSGLLSHYNSPPVSVDYLESITDSSPEVCPMCGGFNPFSRDHILPKSDHQAWSIFSKNLVPACNCNSKRGSALKGELGTGARILHPYFDDILLERLISCLITISPNNNFNFTVEIIYLDLAHSEIASIKYHTENVVLKSGIEKWLRGQLSMLNNKPSNVIHTLDKNSKLTEVEVRGAIEDCLSRTDASTGTPNNWLSIFCHGLLNSEEISSWVTDRHNQTLV